MAYNRDQWMQSFEGQLQILRPHVGDRLMATISNSAWHSRGVKGEDPIAAAKVESKALDMATAGKARPAKGQGR